MGSTVVSTSSSSSTESSPRAPSGSCAGLGGGGRRRCAGGTTPFVASRPAASGGAASGPGTTTAGGLATVFRAAVRGPGVLRSAVVGRATGHRTADRGAAVGGSAGGRSGPPSGHRGTVRRAASVRAGHGGRRGAAGRALTPRRALVAAARGHVLVRRSLGVTVRRRAPVTGRAGRGTAVVDVVDVTAVPGPLDGPVGPAVPPQELGLGRGPLRPGAGVRVGVAHAVGGRAGRAVARAAVRGAAVRGGAVHGGAVRAGVRSGPVRREAVRRRCDVPGRGGSVAVVPVPARAVALVVRGDRAVVAQRSATARRPRRFLVRDPGVVVDASAPASPALRGRPAGRTPAAGGRTPARGGRQPVLFLGAVARELVRNGGITVLGAASIPPGTRPAVVGELGERHGTRLRHRGITKG